MTLAPILLPLAMAVVVFFTPSKRWRPRLLAATAVAHFALTLQTLASPVEVGAGAWLRLDAPGRLPLAEARLAPLLVPASFATVAAGFILITTRRKAISQVLGFLVLENGIFVFGLLLVEAMPFLVEAGVLLDLFVAIFVLTIIIHHINREFASQDTRRLSLLKEER